MLVTLYRSPIRLYGLQAIEWPKNEWPFFLSEWPNIKLRVLSEWPKVNLLSNEWPWPFTMIQVVIQIPP